jgi:hypothetical protein
VFPFEIKDANACGIGRWTDTGYHYRSKGNGPPEGGLCQPIITKTTGIKKAH